MRLSVLSTGELPQIKNHPYIEQGLKKSDVVRGSYFINTNLFVSTKIRDCILCEEVQM
jgi:hypothetical protein